MKEKVYFKSDVSLTPVNIGKSKFYKNISKKLTAIKKIVVGLLDIFVLNAVILLLNVKLFNQTLNKDFWVSTITLE